MKYAHILQAFYAEPWHLRPDYWRRFDSVLRVAMEGREVSPVIELRQHVREYAMRIKMCDEVGKEFGIVLDPDKVFPPAPGSAPNNGDPSNIIQPGDPAFSAPENITRLEFPLAA